MAHEVKRGCGYRKVGGLYLCGSYISIPCDRLPYRLDVCPVCGSGIKVSRGFTKINPLGLFGIHQDCIDKFHPCFLCDPEDATAFIMGVGERHYKTPEDFNSEANIMGISKRIPHMPKELELGKTIVYLAHPKACEVKEPIALQQAMSVSDSEDLISPRLLEAEKIERAMGIFSAFIPQRVELLIWESELNDKKRKELAKRNITPISIPDGDTDHI